MGHHTCASQITIINILKQTLEIFENLKTPTITRNLKIKYQILNTNFALTMSHLQYQQHHGYTFPCSGDCACKDSFSQQVKNPYSTAICQRNESLQL